MSKAPPPDRCTAAEAMRLANAGKGNICIAIDGVVQPDTVTEYCVSKGWARVHVVVNGKPVPCRAGWVTRVVHARIQVWWGGDPLPAGVTLGNGAKANGSEQHG